uniref:Uncharacterized protein n=1 Tax=Anguilla anguilla TaxID=7936 RepID=A0A0E9TUP5_ANGAN
MQESLSSCLKPPETLRFCAGRSE